MPVFTVAIQDRTYHVEIPDPAATPLKVIVDGQAFEVAIASAGMRRGPAAAEMDWPALQARPVATEMGRSDLQPSPLPSPPVAIARPAVPAGAARGREIIAPMPGTILSVAVAAGQAVEVGEVVCVLEAMKMKNPIRATQTGIVAEVMAQPGRTVAYGDLLVRLS
ncbi:MAG: acetyl-CoA carboxylase biotin carboxyl carrier protein subunit [Chloroflexi bacterium]|nr:acetyl-CoA carboxylase biotin carboxyl carrier protein subunit [Chloroflexota bacterium]